MAEMENDKMTESKSFNFFSVSFNLTKPEAVLIALNQLFWAEVIGGARGAEVAFTLTLMTSSNSVPR